MIRQKCALFLIEHKKLSENFSILIQPRLALYSIQPIGDYSINQWTLFGALRWFWFPECDVCYVSLRWVRFGRGVRECSFWWRRWSYTILCLYTFSKCDCSPRKILYAAWIWVFASLPPRRFGVCRVSSSPSRCPAYVFNPPSLYIYMLGVKINTRNGAATWSKRIYNADAMSGIRLGRYMARITIELVTFRNPA